MSLDKLAATLSVWRDNLDLIVTNEAIKKNDEIVEMNANDQMYEGKRSDNSDIKPLYTGYTRKIKRQKGQPDDRVTLKDEGDFYEGMYVREVNDGFVIDSTDEKRNDLVVKYGRDIFGLTDTSKSRLSSLIKQPLQKRLRRDLKI